MQFRLTIELSNEDDGKLSNVDIETALQDAARQFHVPGLPFEAHGRAHLLNGRAVGSWEIVEEPKAGKTLADFAHSGKLFKRPMHRNAYGFLAECGSQLREISTSDWGGTINTCADVPRLTAEDATATDWEEVK